MNSKPHILSVFLLLLAVGSLLSCSEKKEKRTDSVDILSLPQEVQPVAKAIIEDSPETFAAVVSYPVERPYPLKNINDSASMVKYYPKLVDDSLKNVVGSAPDSLWQQEGWRGWTVANGSYFYIDNGKIYSINYISQEEKIMLDSIRQTEIATLDSTLRHGWVPVMCIVDTVNNAIFRIDTYPDVQPPRYRLAGYKSDTDLSGHPTLLLYGNLDMEGTMDNRYYHFTDSIDTTAEYFPDAVENEDSVPEIEVKRKGQIKKYKVKPHYWLDIVSKPGHKNRQAN